VLKVALNTINNKPNAHGQFLGVGQGIKQTYLYICYPLFQAEWDRYDQRNHQTYNYLVKGHLLYSGT
jgi:hypothetical protein